MKIVRFEIHSIRGIRQFAAEVNGRSIVVTGPNGTGKSGIIDSLDFLFSGSIQRLSGTGTGDLSLDKHGKHVDDNLADSYVECILQLASGKTVTVKRGLADRKLVLVKGDKNDFETIVEVLAGGQFQLTRRELLKFIVCEGQTRATEIQALLDVKELDKLRRDLTNLVNDLTKKRAAAYQTYTTTLKEVDTLLDIANVDAEQRRAKINELRALLKKGPITTVADIATDLEQPEAKDATALKRKEFLFAIGALDLARFDVPADNEGTSVIDALRAVTTELSEVEGIKAKLKTYELLRLGLAQVPDSGACPLCDTKWEKHEIVGHIKAKIALTQKLAELSTKFSLCSDLLCQQIDGYRVKLTTLKQHAEKLAHKPLEDAATTCLTELATKRSTLANIEGIPAIVELLNIAKGHLTTTALKTIQDLSTAVATALPEESPEEIAYKKLLKTSGLYKNYALNYSLERRLALRRELAIKTQKAYEGAREKLFTDLYEDVENDFKDFYVYLNQDESTFKAKLDDKGNKVELTVEFYGRGMYPPIALHSEGHQDSMGVCLYLALMKKLKKDGFTIALLDDVMMSIDIGHRRRLCQLLKEKFPNTQFVITTHDPVWARQLREFQIVNRANLFHFRSWSIETGPVTDNTDIYDTLRNHANKNDNVAAAGGLRNNMELELQEICAVLEAKVTYRADHSWNPGELREAAVSRLKDILARAKAAANSWGDNDAVARLAALDARLKAKIAASKSDDWQVNKAVHYNTWATFSKEEMLATIDGIEGLIAGFCCEQCGGKISLIFAVDSIQPTGIACPCSKSTYTLKSKGADA